MLSLLAFSSLLNGIAIVLLGEYILLKDVRNPLNRVFAAFCAVAGAWGFVEFMYRQAATPAVAEFWLKIYAFAWPNVTPLVLHFALIFTDKKNWLKKKSTYLMIYLPSILISITDFGTDLITPGAVRLPWGFAPAIPDFRLYYWLGSLWVAALGGLSLILVWRYRYENIGPKKKSQAGLILVGVALPLTAGMVTHVILPALGIVFPELTTTFLVALVAFVGYGISRYGLFRVSPESAAENIVSTMSDALIIIGPKGNLLSVNKALLDMLGYAEEELLGKYAVVLWAEDRQIRPLLDRLLSEGIGFKNIEDRFLKKNGETIDVLVSTSVVRDQAGQLAGFVAIATDVTELKRAEKARDIADYLQEVMLKLPKSLPGIDFSHLYRSATEAAHVGGDFLDVFELDSHRIGIVVGDVSGKGLEASALTSLIKDTIKAYANLNGSPSFIMNKTNELVVKVSEGPVFASVFFGILSTATGELVYCNAGHPPGLIKRAGKVSALEPTGMVIGAFEAAHFAESRVGMLRGDTLVLYTDGAIEARREGELFGERRLAELIRQTKVKDIRKFTRFIFSRVENHAKGKLSDDAVVLGVRLK
jgi:PAS domain S-box-containing protein